MTTLSRIESSNVQLGNSYVLDNTNKEKREKIQENILMGNAQKKAEEIINNAKIEAEQIIQTATQQSQDLLQQSNDAIDQTKEAGYQAGYDAGFQEGYAKIHEDLTNQIKSMDTLAQSAFKVKKEIISASEKEILQLTTVIAEKIIKQQLEIQPKTILNIINAAINALKDKEEVSIIVNPQLTQYLYEYSEDLKQTIKGLKSIKILEDKTIPPDGIIVESSENRIDARLETQITEIVKQLLIEAEENPILDEIPKEIEIKIEEPPEIEADD